MGRKRGRNNQSNQKNTITIYPKYSTQSKQEIYEKKKKEAEERRLEEEKKKREERERIERIKREQKIVTDTFKLGHAWTCKGSYSIDIIITLIYTLLTLYLYFIL